MKKTIEAAKRKLKETEQQEVKDKEQRANIYKETKYLFQTTKEYFLKKRRLKKTDGPVVFLFRPWGDVDIIEGVRGKTFTVPPAAKDKRKIIDKSYKTLVEGPQVIYLHPSALKNVYFGGHKTKAYFLDEENAMPLKADAHVWSEMMEMVISAVLINYRNLLTKMQRAEWEGIKGIIKWGVLGVLGYIALKAIWPDAPEPIVQETVRYVAQNASQIGEVILT